MAENKTQPTHVPVNDFIASVEHPTRKADAYVLHEMMSTISNHPGVMWGSSIVGYGDYHYKSASGREGDWFMVGFSPRKTSLSVYIMSNHERHAHLFSKLGKFKTGAGCVYINKLADVDISVLKEIIIESVNHFKNKQS